MKNLLFLATILYLFACDAPAPAAPDNDRIELTPEAPAPEVEPDLPFVHTVFFWNADGLTDAQSAELRAGIESLRAVPSVGKMMIGGAAGSENRDVVDHSYDHALIVHFADQAAHDAYQIDPVHTAFVEAHKEKWGKVVVYDSLVE